MQKIATNDVATKEDINMFLDWKGILGWVIYTKLSYFIFLL